MLWTNWSRSGDYYTPFITKKNSDGTMFGHEMIDDFIDLYNSKNSIFANDQKDVLAKLTSGKSQLAENKKYTEPGGYILNLSPYQRINDEIEVQARVNKKRWNSKTCWGNKEQNIRFKDRG